LFNWNLDKRLHDQDRAVEDPMTEIAEVYKLSHDQGHEKKACKI
jgi:hypothetical protein